MFVVCACCLLSGFGVFLWLLLVVVRGVSFLLSVGCGLFVVVPLVLCCWLRVVCDCCLVFSVFSIVLVVLWLCCLFLLLLCVLCVSNS